MDHIILDHQIYVNEICAIPAVCHNTTHMGGSQKDIFRFFRCKKFIDRTLIGQVQLCMGTQNNVCVSFLLQILQDSRTDQTTMTGYKYFTVFIHSFINFNKY